MNHISLFVHPSRLMNQLRHRPCQNWATLNCVTLETMQCKIERRRAMSANVCACVCLKSAEWQSGHSDGKVTFQTSRRSTKSGQSSQLRKNATRDVAGFWPGKKTKKMQQILEQDLFFSSAIYHKEIWLMAFIGWPPSEPKGKAHLFVLFFWGGSWRILCLGVFSTKLKDEATSAKKSRVVLETAMCVFVPVCVL